MPVCVPSQVSQEAMHPHHAPQLPPPRPPPSLGLSTVAPAAHDEALCGVFGVPLRPESSKVAVEVLTVHNLAVRRLQGRGKVGQEHTIRAGEAGWVRGRGSANYF